MCKYGFNILSVLLKLLGLSFVISHLTICVGLYGSMCPICTILMTIKVAIIQ